MIWQCLTEIEELYRICGEVLKDDDGQAIIKITQERAVQNIRDCAELRGLEWSCLVNKRDRFHVDCRKQVTQKDRIKSARVLQKNKPKTRIDSSYPGTPLSTTEIFEYRTCCLFCTKVVCIKHVNDNGHCIIKPKKHLIGDVSFVKSRLGLMHLFVDKWKDALMIGHARLEDVLKQCLAFEQKKPYIIEDDSNCFLYNAIYLPVKGSPIRQLLPKRNVA